MCPIRIWPYKCVYICIYLFIDYIFIFLFILWRNCAIFRETEGAPCRPIAAVKSVAAVVVQEIPEIPVSQKRFRQEII